MKLTSNNTYNVLIKFANLVNCNEIKNFIKDNLGTSRTKFRRIFAINASDADSTLGKFCNYYSELDIIERMTFKNKLQSMIFSALNLNEEYIIDEIGYKTLLLVDIPESGNGKLGEDISVVLPNNTYVRLSEKSAIVTGIISHFDEQLRWLRFFIHEDIYKYFSAEYLSRSNYYSYSNGSIRDSEYILFPKDAMETYKSIVTNTIRTFLISYALY